MEKLNFPNYELRLKNKENKPFIFDRIRKKWLRCTPEEWVRTHCINYLIETKGYPASWMRVEQELLVYGTKKRFDIVVTDALLNPFILVECKAPTIAINQSTLEQISRYNLELNCPFLMMSNGLNHYFCSMDKEQNRISFIESLPNYTKK